MEHEQNRPKLRYWKIVANEKCTPEIAELSSVKNLFRGNHASEKVRISLKQKIIGWTSVTEKKIDYVRSFWRTEEEMAKKRPK